MVTLLSMVSSSIMVIVTFYILTPTETVDAKLFLSRIILDKYQLLQNIWGLRMQQLNTISDNDNIVLLTILHNSIGEGKTPDESLLKETREKVLTLSERYLEKVSPEPQFAKVIILNKFGKVAFSTNKELEKIDFLQDPVFVRGMQEHSYFLKQGQSGKLEITFYVPIQQIRANETGSIGVISMTKIANAAIATLVDRRDLDNTGETYFVNFDRLLVTPSRFIQNAEFKQKVDTIPVKECIEKGLDIDGLKYRDYRGIEVFGSSKCIKELGLVLIAEQDVHERFESLEFLQTILIVMIVVLGISVFIVSLFLVNTSSTIREQLDKLKDVEKLKDEFASMVSHELKTPLFPIKFHAKMLKDPNFGILTDKQIESVNQIYNNAERLEKLIGDLLDVQRLELGTMKFKYSEIELDKIMNDIYDENSIYMNEKNIQFTNTIDEKIIFKSDPDRIKQVFTNILKNSVDFVPEKAGKIEIGAKSDGDKILFYVKDNGIGISKERQKDIFKKFYQIDTSLIRKHGGTGLGLSICNGIVEGLGGKIWVDDTAEKGTTMCFSLPIQTFGNSLKS